MRPTERRLPKAETGLAVKRSPTVSPRYARSPKRFEPTPFPGAVHARRDQPPRVCRSFVKITIPKPLPLLRCGRLRFEVRRPRGAVLFRFWTKLLRICRPVRCPIPSSRDFCDAACWLSGVRGPRRLPWSCRSRSGVTTGSPTTTGASSRCIAAPRFRSTFLGSGTTESRHRRAMSSERGACKGSRTSLASDWPMVKTA